MGGVRSHFRIGKVAEMFVKDEGLDIGNRTAMTERKEPQWIGLFFVCVIGVVMFGGCWGHPATVHLPLDYDLP